MVIRILDHVKSCSTYEDGEKIFRLIHPPLKAGEDVVLSFAGVLSVPSAFINAALVRLLEDIPFETIKRHLKIVDSTRQINALVRQRFAFSAEEESN